MNVSRQNTAPLPPHFVEAMRRLFRIMDTSDTGTVSLQELRQRWSRHPPQSATTGIPPNFIHCVTRVTPPNGMLTFERFCAGLRLAIAGPRIAEHNPQRMFQPIPFKPYHHQQQQLNELSTGLLIDGKDHKEPIYSNYENVMIGSPAEASVTKVNESITTTNSNDTNNHGHHAQNHGYHQNRHRGPFHPFRGRRPPAPPPYSSAIVPSSTYQSHPVLFSMPAAPLTPPKIPPKPPKKPNGRKAARPAAERQEGNAAVADQYRHQMLIKKTMPFFECNGGRSFSSSWQEEDEEQGVGRQTTTIVQNQNHDQNQNQNDQNQNQTSFHSNNTSSSGVSSLILSSSATNNDHPLSFDHSLSPPNRTKNNDNKMVDGPQKSRQNAPPSSTPKYEPKMRETRRLAHGMLDDDQRQSRRHTVADAWVALESSRQNHLAELNAEEESLLKEGLESVMKLSTFYNRELTKINSSILNDGPASSDRIIHLKSQIDDLNDLIGEMIASNDLRCLSNKIQNSTRRSRSPPTSSNATNCCEERSHKTDLQTLKRQNEDLKEELSHKSAQIQHLERLKAAAADVCPKHLFAVQPSAPPMTTTLLFKQQQQQFSPHSHHHQQQQRQPAAPNSMSTPSSTPPSTSPLSSPSPPTSNQKANKNEESVNSLGSFMRHFSHLMHHKNNHNHKNSRHQQSASAGISHNNNGQHSRRLRRQYRPKSTCCEEDRSEPTLHDVDPVVHQLRGGVETNIDDPQAPPPPHPMAATYHNDHFHATLM